MNAAMAGWKDSDPLTRLRVLVHVVCLLVALAAVAVAAGVLISGQLGRQGVDALFLVLVCLLIAFGFALSPLQAWQEGQFRELLRRNKKARSAEGAQAEGEGSATRQEAAEGK